jgi:hypothetical protein
MNSSLKHQFTRTIYQSGSMAAVPPIVAIAIG